MIIFSEEIIIFNEPELIAQIEPLEGMKIVQVYDKEQLIENEHDSKYSILIINIEQLEIVKMALISCKYRFIFILNLQNVNDKKFSRQNNNKFMEILQIDDLNKNLKQVFLEYQITLVKQRTTIQIDGSWTDKRYYINIIYYQRLLQFGDSWINQAEQSPDMKVAINDFKYESQRYIDQNFSSETDDKQLHLELQQQIIDYLQENHDEEEIMEQLLLMYTKESFFYRMLQEYLRIQNIRNLYYIRLPIYFCMKGLQQNSNVKKKLKTSLFRGQYINKKELTMYQNQQQGAKNIMLSFLSCSTIQVAKQFIYKDMEGLEKVILDFKGFTAFKELKSEFNEIEKCLGPLVEVNLQKEKTIGHHKAFEFFKQEKFNFDDNQFGELKRQKQNIMDIFKQAYKNIQLYQAEFSLLYDRDPQFVIDILIDQQFEDFDEAIRLSKLSIAYRMLGNRNDAIKFGEQALLLTRQQYKQKDLQLRMEFAWAYLDDQQFSLSLQRYRDCYFSENNQKSDYKPQILNNLGCIYWNLGQFQKAEKCQYQAKIQKDLKGDKYNLLSKSISRANLWHSKFLLIMHQDYSDEIRCQLYAEILDQLLICISERSKVRDYCHNFDLVILQRISFVLLQMGNIKECQDYCDYVENLITENNNYYESVGLNYYVRAKLLINAKNYKEAHHYFEKSIKYLNDNKYNRRIELIRIYSDYEDFCLETNNIQQATICRNQYLRISSYILNEILRIREIITVEQEQLILAGKFE